MIPMACPNCGRRGSVPPDKLNSRLHCKKCDAVFHMDASGHVVLGEPGSEHRKSDSIFGLKATATKPRAAKDEPMDLVGNLKEAWTGLPKPARIVLMVGVVAGLIWAFVPMPRFGYKVPPDLAGRAKFVADAFVDESASRIRKIAAPDTADDASTWLETVRPTFKHSGPRKQGNLVTVLAPIFLEQDTSKGRARVLLMLLPPQPDPSAGNKDKGYFAPGYRADGTFALPTVWSLGPKGRWLLDGKATLENAKNPPTAKDDPEPQGDPRNFRTSPRGR